MDLVEARAVLSAPLPALPHEVVQLARAGGRARRRAAAGGGRVPARRVLHHLLGRQLGVRPHRAQHQQLPQGHPEGPHVALRGVLTLKHSRLVASD